jgi:hypothetical protein
MALKRRVSAGGPGRLKLRIELVPKRLWGLNLRSSNGLGKARWDKLRHRLIETNGARCAICGSTERVHGHEVWAYREKKTVGTAVLLRVEIVCIDCHDIHHWGRTTKLFRAGVITGDRYRFLRRHFRKVNGCCQQVFDGHAIRSARIWLNRSKKKWKIDWGDFKPALAEAKAAREARAARSPNRAARAGQSATATRSGALIPRTSNLASRTNAFMAAPPLPPLSSRPREIA